VFDNPIVLSVWLVVLVLLMFAVFNLFTSIWDITFIVVWLFLCICYVQTDSRSVHQDAFRELFCKEVSAKRPAARNFGEFVGS